MPSSHQTVPVAFISYTRSDGEFALKLAQDLRANGIAVWIDQVDIPSGAAWDLEIERALLQAGTVLVVLSPDSCERGNVLDEITFALDHGKVVVPVIYQNCDVPLRLVRHQRVDFSSSYEQGLRELIDDLKRSAQVAESATIAPHSETIPAPNSRLNRRSMRALWLASAALVLVVIMSSANLWRHWRRSSVTSTQTVTFSPTGSTTSRAPGATIQPPAAGLALLANYVALRDSKTRDQFTGQAWSVAALDFHERAEQVGVTTTDRQHWKAAEHFALGAAAEYNGNARLARQEFASSIEEEPTWALPRLGMCRALVAMNETDAALQQAQKAESLEPNLWQAVATSAGVFIARREFAKAIDEFHRALRLSDNAPLVLSALAFALHADGQHDAEAAKQAAQVLAADPDCVPAHLILAEVALERGQGKQAFEHTNHATILAPRSSACWLAQGDALLLMGKRSAAKEAFERAILELRDTQSLVPPADRLASVKTALAHGRLPPLRFKSERTLAKDTAVAANRVHTLRTTAPMLQAAPPELNAR